MICNRCQGTGFLNTHQLPSDALWVDDVDAVLEWIKKNEGQSPGCSWATIAQGI